VSVVFNKYSFEPFPRPSRVQPNTVWVGYTIRRFGSKGLTLSLFGGGGIIQCQFIFKVFVLDWTIRSEMAGFSADPKSNSMRLEEDVSDDEVVTLHKLSIEDTDYETLYKQSREENETLIQDHESVVALSAFDAWQIEYLKKKVVELEARVAYLIGHDTQ